MDEALSNSQTKTAARRARPFLRLSPGCQSKKRRIRSAFLGDGVSRLGLAGAVLYRALSGEKSENRETDSAENANQECSPEDFTMSGDATVAELFLAVSICPRGTTAEYSDAPAARILFSANASTCVAQSPRRPCLRPGSHWCRGPAESGVGDSCDASQRLVALPPARADPARSLKVGIAVANRRGSMGPSGWPSRTSQPSVW